ncbi:hypothetical protein ACP4OV_029667 [Aristida adscensionis]
MENPIPEAAIRDLEALLFDVDAVQALLDVVRAETRDNAARLTEAAAHLVRARRSLLEASAARRRAPGSEEDERQVAARVADYAAAAARVEQVRRAERILHHALGFLVALRAAAFAVRRAPLIPAVLLTAAAAYALAYAASGGCVAPGSTSLLWISALVLCFLFGF